MKRTTRVKHGIAALTAAAILIPAAQAGKGGGKGKGNNDGDVGGSVSGEIFSTLSLDDGIDNYLESDDNGPYVYGTDQVEITIGRNRGMQFDFNTHKKKASIRRLNLWSNLPLVEDTDGFLYDGASLVADPTNYCTPILTAPEPLSATPLAPDLTQDQWNLLPDASLNISGEDHDDAEVGCMRYLNARLIFTDASGETWHLYFGGREHGSGSYFAPCGSCLLVTRLPNLDEDEDPTTTGTAQWSIQTEWPHLGYLYHDNRPPHSPTALFGVVQLPLSGVVTSLTQEAEPDPDNPETHCLDSEPCPVPDPIVLP